MLANGAGTLRKIEPRTIEVSLGRSRGGVIVEMIVHHDFVQKAFWKVTVGISCLPVAGRRVEGTLARRGRFVGDVSSFCGGTRRQRDPNWKHGSSLGAECCLWRCRQNRRGLFRQDKRRGWHQRPQGKLTWACVTASCSFALMARSRETGSNRTPGSGPSLVSGISTCSYHRREVCAEFTREN